MNVTIWRFLFFSKLSSLVNCRVLSWSSSHLNSAGRLRLFTVISLTLPAQSTGFPLRLRKDSGVVLRCHFHFVLLLNWLSTQARQTALLCYLICNCIHSFPRTAWTEVNAALEDEIWTWLVDKLRYPHITLLIKPNSQNTKFIRQQRISWTNCSIFTRDQSSSPSKVQNIEYCFYGMVSI